MTYMQALERMARFSMPSLAKNADQCEGINEGIYGENPDDTWSAIQAAVFAALEQLGDPPLCEATDEDLEASKIVSRMPYSLMQLLVKRLTSDLQIRNSYWFWRIE